VCFVKYTYHRPITQTSVPMQLGRDFPDVTKVPDQLILVNQKEEHPECGSSIRESSRD
jgi:hypothetical protein